MTEDDARVKWCPATGMRTLYDAAARHPANAGEGMNTCIGTACMAWRWNCIVADGVDAIAPVRLETGFCGLAGAPQ